MRKVTPDYDPGAPVIAGLGVGTPPVAMNARSRPT
jgi:hypothetical protein